MAGTTGFSLKRAITPLALKVMRRLDWYILGKFLGTFFFSILLIIVIVIVFDISEKIEDFIQHNLSASQIFLEYYLNFIPYFVNLFSPLFTFISVIFFTSRMAYRTEIVAILNAGVSFRRFLRPYMIGAGFIAVTSLLLNNWIIPKANKERLLFEARYIGTGSYNSTLNRDIHRQTAPGEMVYIQHYNHFDSTGYKFTIEKFDGLNMTYKLSAEEAAWNESRKAWVVRKYFERKFTGDTEDWKNGDSMTIKLNLSPKDFERAESVKESMTYGELNDYIAAERLKGSSYVQKYEAEKHYRIVFPFATFILTLIGVALSSRKVRGGIGLHLGLGVGIAFSYILLMKVFVSFAETSVIPAYIALWIPNVIYMVLALYLLKRAPK